MEDHLTFILLKFKLDPFFSCFPNLKLLSASEGVHARKSLQSTPPADF